MPIMRCKKRRVYNEVIGNTRNLVKLERGNCQSEYELYSMALDPTSTRFILSLKESTCNIMKALTSILAENR
ncbi:hypothetical protein TNIN_453841 [Trichonephila inaurata madagascariensis]|uniref:Uncharacterized protein n=1 Tax=Trichonephila inaurata madagascariensis TaxID=2747483 RepID=A0A8X6XTJ0_9ARAC|nr:hypothetical protein TNIN_453841 [Trichonephila inaurata madagascariensis]